MPLVLVFCRAHGLQETTNFQYVGDVTITIGDATDAWPATSGMGIHIPGGSTACPICGVSSDFVNGVYAADDSGQGTATLSLTSEQTSLLRAAAAWGRDQLQAGAEQSDVEEQIHAALERHAPAWKRAIDALTATRTINVIQLLGFILMLLTFFGVDPAGVGHNSDPGITDVDSFEDRLRDLFDEYLERGEDSGGPSLGTPPPAEPTPPPPAG